jgi:hypothetical protein
MAKRRSIDSLAVSNPLFGEHTQGSPTNTQLPPAKDGPEATPQFRHTDLPAGHVHPKKSRERKTSRPR